MIRPESEALRVAFISLHTSPLDQPGTGDSGGMNVYVRELAERLAPRGVEVDIYTRCAGRGVPDVEELVPGVRILQVPAGPCAPVPKDALPGLLPAFVREMSARDSSSPYDLIHAHYWLSGRAGQALGAQWDAPLVASFHTLGRVKNLAPALTPEPDIRLLGEESVIRRADRILVATDSEARHLVELYQATPQRIRVVHPGVDHTVFRPLPKEDARAGLGLAGRRVVLFVGRLQPLKGPDVAIRSFAEALVRDPGTTRDLVLLVVGGPSGTGDEIGDLRLLAARLGVENRVLFHPPVAHELLPEVYAAADVVLVPSRSESFGLVALEAQACGVPVVAAAVEGLRSVVADRRSGFLVAGHDPAEYADRLLSILRSPDLAARLSRGAVARASRFPWEETADRVLSVYGELTAERLVAVR